MTLLAQVVRNGVTEAEHHGVVAVVAPGGELIASYGDVDRPFFGRSSLKPFQAKASLDSGADVAGPALAVACASHGANPIHVAYVESMLAGVGDPALQTPPAWPMADAEYRRQYAAGERQPRRIWHNCSGKHAAMLRACVASGWPVDSYLDPGHSLQERVRERIVEATGAEIGAAGVDGCGAPVYTTSARKLAAAFAHLATAPDYQPIWTAMHRYPALVGEHTRIDQVVASISESAAKVGAEGLVGIAVRGQFGIVVKSWDGTTRAVEAGVAAAMEQLGLLNGSSRRQLEERLYVMGGGMKQGLVEPRVVLA